MPRREMIAISKYKDRFRAHGVKVMVDDYKYVDLLNHKDRAYEAYRAEGVGNVPDYYMVTTAEQFKYAYDKLKEKYKWICFKFVRDEGGMSFHGGLIGAVVGGLIECRALHISFPTMCDLAAGGAPLGIFLGRCANFVNGELWGKETTLPWGVMFSDTGGGMVYRHPSQLYEALLEGLVMFVILWLLSRKLPPHPQGFFIGMFLTLYGCFRFCIEFVRLPDAQMGYLLGTSWLTMGQVLSLPLVLVGILLIMQAKKRNLPQRIYG